jgi:2-hydroxychromene-2-carboxylate isomerase
MKHITFYLDFISPYAYLAFEHLPEALKGLSYSVSYRPVLFAAMLKHHGQLGPAEIAPKRDWTYRQVLWHAHSKGIAMRYRRAIPSIPLPLLRLAAACGTPADPASPTAMCAKPFFAMSGRVAPKRRRAAAGRADALLAPQHHLTADEAKAQLKKNTDDAIALNVFGVPAMEVDGKIFWGFDALPMLREPVPAGQRLV